MAGWTKLFNSILTSTVWLQDHATVRVWITLLAAADAEGYVEGSVPGLARLAGVTVDEMRRALEIFQAPDPDSRTSAHEGRRIEKVEGGYVILNYVRYRLQAQAKEGSRAPYYRAYRQRKREEVFAFAHDPTDDAGRQPGEDDDDAR